MRVPGFEPGTSALSELRSSQLSYTRDVQLQPSPTTHCHPLGGNKKAKPFGLAPRDGSRRKSYLSGGTVRRMVIGFSVGVADGLLDNTRATQRRQPDPETRAL